jgi:hypothetical protein
VSSPFSKNISLFQKFDRVYGSPIPPPPEGRIAIVTDVGSGCDGRFDFTAHLCADE